MRLKRLPEITAAILYAWDISQEAPLVGFTWAF
jgi:hypothetical protein